MLRQKVRNLISAIGQSTANMTGEEFAILKRLVEKRDREAAQVTVTPVSTVQHCSTRSLSTKISIGTRICMQRNEGKMDPESTELEPPSAGKGIEAPGQQCPPNEGTWETGRTIADGYFLVDMGSNQGGDISSPTEHVGTRAGTATTQENSSNTIFRKASRKPRDKTPSEENKHFDPGGKREKSPLWNAAVIGIGFLSWGELWAMGGPLLVLRVFLSVSFCLLCLLFYCIR